MNVVLWLSVVGILYPFVLYPMLMWALARCRPKHCMIAPISPSVSIVLAVHNGLCLLPRQIARLLALDYPNIEEIIIVSDGSTDGTAELLMGLRHPSVKSIILEQHCGKATALNAGMAKANAEVILFVDLRPEIGAHAIQQIVTHFADPTVGCVTGEVVLFEDGKDQVCAAIGGLYWRYEQWIRKCEAAYDSPVGVYGGFYAIRRRLAVPQPAGMILDDMFEPLSIIRQGYRSVFEPSAHVYDSWPKNFRGEFHRKVRTLAGNFQLFQVAPWTLMPGNRVMFQLISHKALRLFVPYWMILALVSSLMLSAGSVFYGSLAGLQIFSLAIAVVGLRFRIPIFHRIAAPAGALLVLNAAAVVGLYEFLSSGRDLWKIWNANDKPVAARRTALAAIGSGTSES